MPSLLLFLLTFDCNHSQAIDGVAPRAKMNQQRSRRFRSAHDAKEQKAGMFCMSMLASNHIVATARFFAYHASFQSIANIAIEMERKGLEVPTDMFDSNCITPGTEFMARLNVHLAFYIKKRIKEDPRWQKVWLLSCFSLLSISVCENK